MYNFSEKGGFHISLFLLISFLGIVLFAHIIQIGRQGFEARATEMAARQSKDNTDSNRSASNRSNQSAVPASAVNEERQQAAANNKEPLTITGVGMLTPSYKCTGDTTLVTIGGMRLLANANHRAAAYTWKVDILGDHDYSTREQWRGRIPAGETDYNLTYSGTETQSLYSRAFMHPHSDMKIRIRVTSPNDAASAWFEVPTSDNCR